MQTFKLIQIDIAKKITFEKEDEEEDIKSLLTFLLHNYIITTIKQCSEA